MYHDIADTGIIFKFLESVPRMRIMSGSDHGANVEECWKDVLFRMIGPDGLLYTPLLGPGCVRPRGDDVPRGDQMVDQQVNGLALGAIATYAALGEADIWGPIGRGVVDGLRRLAVSRDDMAYFEKWRYDPGQAGDPSAPRPLGTFAAYGMWPARRLIHFYRVSGYQPALDLAGQLCRYVVREGQYFGPNCEFLRDNPDPEGPRYNVTHFHHHAMTILTCLEYGLTADDQEMLDFAVQAFPVAKTYGECLLGYFPESVNRNGPHTCLERAQTCEICEVADMVRIALRMAEAGFGDAYWDDADRWVRNQLAEGQFLRYSWIYRLHQGDPPSQMAPHMTAEQVGKRNIGAFGGWMSPNDWVKFDRRACAPLNDVRGFVQGIMHCCTGNGTRALYDAWRNIVHVKGEEVVVNLLLNYTDPMLDIGSHVPYAGQVDIKVKQGCRLSVRMPGWVDLAQVECKVDQSPRSWVLNGRRIQIGEVEPGQSVQVTFPLAERTDCVTINDQRYFLVRKGHDVVFIDPPGKLCPLYRRDHYRDGVTLWKQTMQYISEQSLTW
jgi:hypothetical protein